MAKFHTPPSRSLLEKLWPAIHHEVLLPEKNQEQLIEKSSTPTLLIKDIKRLTLSWNNPIQEHMATDLVSVHQKPPGFKPYQNNRRHIGTIVHFIFEQISMYGAEWWQSHTAEAQHSYINQQLKQFGVSEQERMPAIKQINNAVANALQDTRGQWILFSNKEAKSEFALTAMLDGSIKSLIIDRTFIDDNNTRWIIDYKTSASIGDDVAEFLLAEKDKYQEKMSLYKRAMQLIDARPIRLGLYFPLVPAWHEWSLD